jgi:hypothetical protein
VKIGVVETGGIDQVAKELVTAAGKLGLSVAASVEGAEMFVAPGEPVEAVAERLRRQFPDGL